MGSPTQRTTNRNNPQSHLATQVRPADSADDYLTPPWVLERLGVTFDLDVAAPAGGVPWVPAARIYTKAQDGLTAAWNGRVWMHPPYSQPKPWVDRFIEHGNGIALLPDSTAPWFRRLWDAEVGFLPLDHVRFHTREGALRSAIPMRCWLVGAGDESLAAIEKLGHYR